MLIPWGTDAPIYHWPIATTALIALNIAMIAGQATGAIDPEAWGLALGSGIHPLQWITHSFLHKGIGNLVGNMLFLWIFGLIVEGKLGFFRFLLIYLLIAVIHGASLQILLQGIEPRIVLGASAAVSGLMAICLIWAPFNEIQCYGAFWSFRLVTFEWDAPIWLLSGFYIAMEAVWLWIGGLSGLFFGSALMNMSGAVWGFLVGIVMLKQRWVDCEGWDVFTRMAHRATLGRQWKAREKRLDHAKRQPRPKVVVAAPEDAGGPSESAAAVRKVQKLVEMGDYDAAIATFDRLARALPAWPPREDLVRWIRDMQKAGGLEASIPLMRAFTARFPDEADRMRLRLAQAYLRQSRPVRAQRTLAEVDREALPADLQDIHAKLTAHATQLVEEGVLEVDGD